MTTNTVTQSAELMENYLQADFLEPQKAFIALQTDTGSSLLFSISTDGVLYLVEELQGAEHGWSRIDLSSARVHADFPQGAVCKTISAAQQPAAAGKPAEIHLAMVLNDGTNDHLYVSLGNSDADLGWADGPAWTAAPYNATDATGKPMTAPTPFEIAGVLISEATDHEYVVVDILRDPVDPAPVITRYYLDVSTAEPAWRPHDVAVDLEAVSYQSCLGRNDHSYGVDGLYTAGTIDGLAQLIYTPLYNAFNPKVAASPARLLLEGAATAERIAAVRNPDNSSDLYTVSGEALSYFASTNQHDQAEGAKIVTHPLLSGTRALFASTDGDLVTIWGLSGSDQVFYLTCARAQVSDPGAWSVPMPILSGVDAISPYIDRQYSANTFFAHATDTLVKAVKTPGTGIWRRCVIPLPPLDVKADATRISSYTTRIQVSGDTGQGVAGVPVTLTAADLTSVYINHLYYRIGPDPIVVPTDALGSITIVEATHTLTATRFSATIDGQDHAINPMDAAFQRNAQLDSVDKLKAAVITNRDGTTRPFLPTGTSDADLRAVAQSNQGLAKAYAKHDSTTSLTHRVTASSAMLASAPTFDGIEDGILTDLGDLFSWIESGVEAVVSVVEDAAGEVWHFIARIAGDVYYGVLDCVEKIVAAALWIYNAVKVIVEDIIAFLEFLFGWHDILTTHQVFRNLLTQYAQSAIDDIDGYKAALPRIFGSLQSEIDAWADIPDFNQTPAGTTTANPPLAGQNSAPAHLGVHHFQNNVASGTSGFVPVGPSEEIFKDLLDLITAEGHTLIGAIDAVKADVIDQFDDLSATQIIERILAILADTLIQTAQNVLEAVLEILAQLSAGLMDVLTATIDIPVLSWLYRELTGDDLSLIDLLCLIAAIPATLVYKIGADEAPFTKGDAFTDGLINAHSFVEVRALFFDPPAASSVHEARPTAVLADGDPVPAPAPEAEPDQHNLKILAFSTGVMSLIGAILLVLVGAGQRAEDASEDADGGGNGGDDGGEVELAAGLSPKKLLATVGSVSNVLYVSPNFATFVTAGSSWSGELNNALTGISVVKGFAFIPAAESSDGVKLAFAVVESVINTIWNVPVIANIIENKDDYDTTYKSLIPESIGNFAFNLGGMLEWPIAVAKDPDTKAVEIVSQAALMIAYGAASTIAGGIYAWAADQHH
jgi:hypothetical protein